MRSCCWMIASLVFAVVSVAADVGTSALARTTSDRESDLLESLIRHSRFADAVELCTTKIAGSEGVSLDRARWTVGLARAKSSQLLAAGALSDEQIAQSTAPVTELLESYGDSEYRVFLQFHQIETLRSACLQDCLSASINGQDSEDSRRAVERGARLIRESELLLKQAQEQRSSAEAVSSRITAPIASDLEELSQRLRVNIVQTMLTISEVFNEGSDDQRDAATKALRYSDSAVQSLSNGSAGWIELQLLRIEAILRTGNASQAMEVFQSLPSTSTRSLEPTRIALRLRLGMASEQWSSVSRQLKAFFGETPGSAPASFEMDLVQLRFLLRMKSLPSDEVSTLGFNASELDRNILDWIDVISLRNGEYERRRAESIVLRELKASSLDTENKEKRSVDPSLVATQGEDWLRRGNPKRAAELLAAAALADTDGTRSITYATKAAASYSADKDLMKAASILYRTAMQHPSEPRSSTIAIQATTLLGQTKEAKYNSQIETMHRESIMTWPIEGPVASARTWLIESLKQQNRYLDAAEVASLNYLSSLSVEKLDEIVSLWQLASVSASGDELTTMGQRFLAAFDDTDYSTQPLARDGYLASASFALDVSQLKELPQWTRQSDENLTPHFEVPLALLRFRNDLQSTTKLQSPDKRWRDPLESRLMHDANTNSMARKPVAKLIESWPDGSQTSLNHIRRLAWLGQFERAQAAAKQLASSSTAPGNVIRDLARTFEDSDDRRLQREAVNWLDELASGLPRGSDEWHDSKIRAAKLLATVGETAEALKRVQYALLTQPPNNESLRARYESIKQQGK